MILVDTSGLIANYDADDPNHDAAAAVLAGSQRRILSPFVLAELDYLIAIRVGSDAEKVVLEDVARGAYELAPFDASNVAEALAMIERFADLDLGLADASIAVLSNRHACNDLLTLDQRHFRIVSGSGGKPFRILPADL